MITCSKCNHQVEDEAKFCDNCGNPLTNIETKNEAVADEAIEYEATKNEAVTDEATKNEAVTDEATKNEALTDEAIKNEAVTDEQVSRPIKKKFSKKIIIVSSIGAIATIVVTLLILFTFKERNLDTNYALYLKDDQIYYTGTKKIEPSEITTHLFDEDLDEYAEYIGTSVGAITMLSNDGKTIFFPDKVSNDNEGFALYYRYLNKKDAEPGKIDSDVFQYSVDKNASLITYLKGGDGNLYQSNLTEKNKIDSNVYKFYVSDDGNKIIYVNTEGSIYLKNKDADKVKIDGDASIEYVSEDLSTVYYLKDETLYKKNENEDKVKVSSDVASIIKIYETGEVYFIKSDSTEMSLMDYVQDDMIEADNMLTRPESLVSPYSWDYDTKEEYEAAKLVYAEYKTAYNAYSDKLDRDSIREYLAETPVTESNYSLFYYNGSESTTITDALVYDGYIGDYAARSDYATANDAAVIIFKTYNESNINKIKFSAINSISDVEELAYEDLDSSSELHVSLGGNTSDIGQTEAQNFSIDSAGKTIYFLDNINNEKNYGDLYKINVSEESTQKAELYDADVSTTLTRFISEDKYMYYKDVKAMVGELYINKDSIDYDVSLDYTKYDDKSDAIAYFTDWNSEKSYGTLKVQNNDESSKIADDVHAFNFTPSGEVLYLYDYSSNYSKGELYLYDGGEENEKIDDDVSAIIPMYTSAIKRIDYGL